MEITEALAGDLTTLTQALDDGVDVRSTLRQLGVNAREAVESYLGLTVTILIEGEQIILTAFDDAAGPIHIRTSLKLELAGDGINTASPNTTSPSSAPTIDLILYAGTAGAFTDLAADLIWVTGRDPAEFVVDQHLELPLSTASMTTLAAMTVVNQAIGVLIAQGHTAEQAMSELARRARLAAVDRRAAAQSILDALDTLDETDAPIP